MTSKHIFYIFLCCILASSCQNESVFGPDSRDYDLAFTAGILETSQVKARTPSADSTTFITHDAFDCDFYMELNTTLDGADVTNYGTYIVPSTYEGRLDLKIDGNPDPTPLNWKSLRGDHIFTGWTFPSGGLPGYGENPFADLSSTAFKQAMENGVKITFPNSSEEDGYDTYNNNEIYEKFIGTKEGPVSYVQNGSYVPLIFKHLVSKIYIDEIILDQFGTQQEHLKANMTIYGLPTSAIFYPDPSQAVNFDESKNYNGGWPVVVPDPQEGDEFTFYIENSADNQDYVWICPEVDFSNLSFSVSISSTESGYDEMKDYSGTFHNVVFERTGTNWDSTDDSTVLHAGEMMILRIILYPGGGAGLYIKILPWSTHDPENTAHYSHQGIYSQNALNEIANNENPEDVFSLYGTQESTGDGVENVFYLYENVNFSNQSNLEIASGYVLDGKNHLITCNKNPLTIQNIRNVYLKYNNYYIYIDGEGNVYKINSTTFEPDPEDPIGTLTTDKPYVLNFTN